MTASILNGLFCCNLAFDSEALHYYYYLFIAKFILEVTI